MATSSPDEAQVPGLGQGLLKRNPAMSREEFSDHWYYKHAALVVPYFLESGVEYYAQIHNPTLAPTATVPLNFNISDWDGAAEMRIGPSPTSPPGAKEYYAKYILPDEKRFLVSEALEHLLRVDEGTVIGDRRVVIEGGRCVLGGEFWSEARVAWEGREGKAVKEGEGGGV